MTMWIAVAFFCVGGDCAFWKADENYYSQEKCEAKVKDVLKALGDSAVDGVCLPVKVNAI